MPHEAMPLVQSARAVVAQAGRQVVAQQQRTAVGFDGLAASFILE